MVKKVVVLAAAVCLLMLAGCGKSNNGDQAAYCKVAVQVNQQQGPPTRPQLDQLKKDAPSAIRSDVAYVVDQIEKPGAKFLAVITRSDVAPRFQKVTDYETKQCGIQQNNGPPQSSAAPAAGARPVTVSAVEFKFNNIPATISAGEYAVTLTNQGAQDHEFVLVELKPGATADQVIAAAKTGGKSAAQQYIAKSNGGSGGPVSPGASKTFGVTVGPGKTYMYVCFLGNPPHAFTGMYGSVTTSG